MVFLSSCMCFVEQTGREAVSAPLHDLSPWPGADSLSLCSTADPDPRINRTKMFSDGSGAGAGQ